MPLYTQKPGIKDAQLSNELKGIQRSIEELYPSVKTWTPQLWDSSVSGSEGQTYSSANGIYFRFGDMVFVQGRITMSSLGTLTTSDTVLIGNLPYTASNDNTTCNYPITIGYILNLNLAAAVNIIGHVTQNGNHIVLRAMDSTSGNTDLLISEITATFDVIFSGWYKTDQKP